MTALDQLRSHVQERALMRALIAIDLTVQDTQAHASRRSGELAAGITATGPSLAETRVTSTIISAAPYSIYQDIGTGIYGPTGTRIFPTKPGGVLRFDWPAAGGIVFAKSVAGAPGTHFFHEPMPDRWHEALVAAGEVT